MSQNPADKITAFLQAAEAYRKAFKKRTAAWDASESYAGKNRRDDPEAQRLVAAYRAACVEYMAADHELGMFLTGDEPLA